MFAVAVQCATCECKLTSSIGLDLGALPVRLQEKPYVGKESTTLNATYDPSGNKGGSKVELSVKAMKALFDGVPVDRGMVINIPCWDIKVELRPIGGS